MSDANSDLSALQRKPFLSHVIEVEKFKRGQANIIVAPCHSGKTTAVGKIITAHASCPERVLCLIDTKAGKEAMISRKEAIAYCRLWIQEIKREWWGDLLSGNGCRVMTYHQFGWEVQRDSQFLSGIELIICDEMHNLIKYIGIEKKNKKNAASDTNSEGTPCSTALNILTGVTSSVFSPMLVIMTATVNSLSMALHRKKVPCEYFDYTGKVRCDLTRQRLYYAHFEDVISSLPAGTRAIIYTTQISQMLEFVKLADDGHRRTCCLWGQNNTDHEMSEKQLEIRKTILTTKYIPHDIDLLFINAAYETSININNEDFNTMIIHSSNVDVQIQVRGRLRHDIDALYLYDLNHEHAAQYFPAEYYGRPLYREDTNAIAEAMNLKNKDGRELQWSSIHKLLAKDGLIVSKQKKNGKNCWFVHPAPVATHSEEVA